VEHRIVGEGDHREATQFAIADLGLGATVELLGVRQAAEVRELLAWADVLVHPSLTEAFGVAVIEAQAMGLPVVCSDAGGLPENVEHEVTGFVVARRDAVTMADRLAELAGDPVLRRRMGRAARRRAERLLSLEHQLDCFEQLYSDLLGAPVEQRGEPAPGPRVRQLREELAALESRQSELRLELWRREVLEEVRAFTERALPAGSRVLVVSHGDEEVVELGRCRGAHFPQEPDGTYAGHHPADSSEAVAHLEALRVTGAEFLLVPATSGWWLDHYQELARHLEQRYLRIDADNEHLVAFSLAPAALVA
jgi:hypothetical protein